MTMVTEGELVSHPPVTVSVASCQAASHVNVPAVKRDPVIRVL